MSTTLTTKQSFYYASQSYKAPSFVAVMRHFKKAMAIIRERMLTPYRTTTQTEETFGGELSHQ